ncbi:MAG: RICIN domain-containing protein [Verrucomicrobiota bacterium]|nr:RICIN domain-containing protein [Verrucomicrobiota bacterium]
MKHPLQSMLQSLKKAGLFVASATLPFAASAAIINVSNSSQLASAVGGANPGDTIVMASGSYSGFTMTRNGTASAPITIESATLGGAVITSGTIQLNGCAYITLDGINFTTSGGSSTVDGVVRYYAVLMDNAAFCRVMQCSFDLSGQHTGTGWITLGGNSETNQIDHCAFGPNSVGSHSHYIFPTGSPTIPGVTPPACRQSWADGNGPYNPAISRYTEIDYNYFHDMGSGDGEIIVPGGVGVCGDYQNTHTTIEHNLFVNCNGDPEVVSIKSSSNTVRYNTFSTCGGVVSFRSGNGSSVYGNFFLCGGVSGSGGCKINEMHHKFYDNYVENAGSYPIMLEDGDYYCTNTFAHAQVVDAEIEYNTVVTPALEVLVGHSSTRPLKPTGCVFANNILEGSGTLYQETSGSSVTRSQNISYSYNPGLSGFIIQNPLLTSVTENSYSLQKLSSSSPAIGAADATYYPYVTTDMDGQPRGSAPDIGADQYSTAAVVITPLTTSDVGPNSLQNNPDFSISASPSSQTVTAGNGTTYTTSISALNGFSGAVSLGVSGLPSGASASFSPSSISTSGNSTLTVSTASTTPAGTYNLTITGSSGSLTHSTTVSLTVNAAPTPDFSLSASPTSLTITQGGNGTSAITVNPVNGYNNTVSLSASGLPSGVTASFNPSSTTSSSTLTLSASSTAATGSATVTITGTDGTLTHTTTISLTVNAASGGGLPAGWTDIDIGSVGLAGSASYSSGTFTVNGSGSDIWSTSDSFNYAYQSVSGDQTIIARVASQQNTSSWAKSGVMFRDSTAANGAYVAVYVTPSNGVSMQIRPSDGAGAIDAARQTGLTAPYWVKIVRSGNTFTGYSSPDGSTWTEVAATNVTMASGVDAGLAVCAHNNTVLNTSTFDNVSISGSAPPPDFSISASPSSQTVTAGSGTSFTTTVGSLNGFSSSVSFSASGLPSGASASFNPTSVSGSGNSTLTVNTSSSTPAGTYTLTITGTSGSLTHSTTVSLTVNAAPDYSLSASPTSLSITQGANGTSTITVNPINGYSGTVSLSASGLPSGVTASFNPASTTGSSTLTLTASSTAATGNATVTITGTDGTLTHTTTISLTVNAASGGGLPAGWTDTDIGSVGLAGSASYSGGTFTVNGSGSDIWSTSDSFNYAWQSVSGDQTIIARVASQQNTSSWAKSGAMFRDSTAANGAYVAVYVTPANGVSMQIRPSDGAGAIDAARQTGLTAPYWVKIVRSGNTFTGYSSPDGSTWTEVAATNVTMASGVDAGLAVCAHNNTALNTSTFDNVSISGSAPPPDFSLSASPTSLTIVQGANGTSTISIVPVNGYNNTVSLSASGLPSGVTASFNPSSTTSSSTLTLTASSTAATGSATVTITGTDGTLTHTTTISLTVNASSGGFAGTYQLQNEASGLVMNNQGSTTQGTAITQWSSVTSQNLDWTFNSAGCQAGYYQIVSVKSGLDAVVQGASTSAGAGIVQWSFGSSGNDQWQPQANSDGSYTFVNLNSGLVLEDPGSSTSTSTQMDQWTSNGGANQMWMLLLQ